MIQYLVCGITIASDLILPAFCISPTGGDGRVDAVVARTDQLPMMSDVRETGPNWMLSARQYRLRVPGIVDMLVSDGHRIDYVMLGGSGDDAAAFIGSTGLGALLHQREDVVMHASAVQVGKGAVLFCGPSGAGKSTIAAGLVERGYPLVNDDFCALRDDAGTIMLYPDGREHKLWQEAVDSLSVGERVGKAVRPALNKFYVSPRLVSGNDASLPVVAIYALKEDRRETAATITRLNVVDAARAVRQNAYRPMLTRLMGQQKLYFEMTTKLLRQAKVANLVRRLDFKAMPAVIDALEAEWRGRGLIGSN